MNYLIHPGKQSAPISAAHSQLGATDVKSTSTNSTIPVVYKIQSDQNQATRRNGSETNNFLSMPFNENDYCKLIQSLGAHLQHITHYCVPNTNSVMSSSTVIVDHLENSLCHASFKRFHGVSGNISLSGEDVSTKGIYYLELLSIIVIFPHHPSQRFSVRFKSGKHVGWSIRQMVFSWKK